MILFFGYLNKGNFGDDLLLQIASREVKYFSILSSSDDIFAHLLKIIKADKIVLLGGLFQDETSLRSCLYYSFVVVLAKIFAKKIESKATGIGPFKHYISKKITAFSYSLMDEVTVRDGFSSQFLTNNKIKHSLVRDLAFSWNYDETRVDKSKFSEAKYHVFCHNPRLTLLDSSNKLEIISEANQKPSSDLYIYASEYNTDEWIYFFKYHCLSLMTQRFHIAVLAKLAGIKIQTSDDCFKIKNLIDSFAFDLINE